MCIFIYIYTYINVGQHEVIPGSRQGQKAAEMVSDATAVCFKNSSDAYTLNLKP